MQWQELHELCIGSLIQYLSHLSDSAKVIACVLQFAHQQVFRFHAGADGKAIEKRMSQICPKPVYLLFRAETGHIMRTKVAAGAGIGGTSKQK
ncbi:hypothetical protein SDC9_131198 [bioreactor metagenome]|uniref:Uncharacterized protein n=1 Tax=bioreactor metagenome TaxID=1076179 RepID=A0A645D4L3_9ZZZZ